jgi:cobalt/nickel transport system permease protein
MASVFDTLPAPDSPLATWDPRWKLAAFVIAVGCTVALNTIPASAAGLALSLLLVAVGRVPLRWYLHRLSLLGPFLLLFGLALPFFVHRGEPLVSFGPITLTDRGVSAAALICLKGVAVVTFVLVLLTASPFHVTLQAAHALRVPGLLVHLTLLTYRYIFVLAMEFSRLRTALRVRGFRSRMNAHGYRTVAHVAGALLVRSHERAERVGHAMRCRGFDGQFRSLVEFHTRAGDVLLFVLLAAPALGLLAWDLWRR